METTRGVKVTCCPLFIPERSSVVPESSYFFAYRIKISMDVTQKSSDSCTLSSRHWIITDGNGKIETVQGSGVIGMFPEMYPGAKFEYASCCPMTTPTGNMGGSFQFVKKTGEEVEVVVPQFKFVAPSAIVLNFSE
jgi:uncharacterized protein affecting Mg2+/Co2+ transport